MDWNCCYRNGYGNCGSMCDWNAYKEKQSENVGRVFG